MEANGGCDSTPLNHHGFGSRQTSQGTLVIFILGGTGKIGSSTAAGILRSEPAARVILGGRNGQRGAEAAEWISSQLPPGASAHISFCQTDAYNGDALAAALRDSQATVLVNCAGPFQRQAQAVPVRVAIDCGVRYVDLCDDYSFSCLAKEYHEEALARGVACVTTGGVFPGLSNVIAAELVLQLHEHGVDAEELKLDYFVAGTGGTGPTVLATTFMIAAEPAVMYEGGVPAPKVAFDERCRIAFPAPVGTRSTYYFDLPETHTCHRALAIPSVSARFATAPDLWNTATRLLIQYAPWVLHDTAWINRLIWWSGPYIKAADWLVGESLAMHIVVSGNRGARMTSAVRSGDLRVSEGGGAISHQEDDVVQLKSTYYHPQTAACTADAMAAMALSVARGDVAAGVWWPEEAWGTAGTPPRKGKASICAGLAASRSVRQRLIAECTTAGILTGVPDRVDAGVSGPHACDSCTPR